jgi:hypothetical protein
MVLFKINSKNYAALTVPNLVSQDFFLTAQLWPDTVLKLKSYSNTSTEILGIFNQQDIQLKGGLMERPKPTKQMPTNANGKMARQDDDQLEDFTAGVNSNLPADVKQLGSEVKDLWFQNDKMKNEL